MKKSIVLLLTVVMVILLAAFASADEGVQKKLDTLMDTRIPSLSQEDIDALIS